MDRKRMLTLALENLEKQRADFEAAIEQIRELKGEIRRAVTKKPGTPILVAAKRRSRTQAERRAQSGRMKAYWAAKRAQATKLRSGLPSGEPKPRRRSKS